MTNAKTLVVGLGEVGGALAEVFDRTAPVLRHDIERVEFDEPIGVMHLCFRAQDPAEYERLACEYIERFKPALTIINSTVVPGTTRGIAEASGARVAFSPVRGKHARMTEDLMHYVKFVAAADVETARWAEEHFQRYGFKTRRMNRIETLELAKLGETTYFGVLIAYAQELNRYCDRLSADYYEATQYFDEIEFLPKARYFPGVIGGHCVLPNIHLLLQLAESPFLDAVLESNSRRTAEIEGEPAARANGKRQDGKMLASR